MLRYETVQPLTLELLRRIQKQDELEDFLLVGGTALALQLGHRMSIDLDFFRHSDEGIENVLDSVAPIGEMRIINRSERLTNLYINDVKVDFVSYRYEFIDRPIIADNLRLASMQDIAAMKLSAITGRGTRKDFVDLYFLLEHFSLAEMFDLYRKKYPDGSDFMVYKSLSYFLDAESDPMPKMLDPLRWETVKERVVNEVNALFP